MDIEVFLNSIIEKALEQLDQLHLVRYDRKTGYLSSTELGRITSHYYVACETIDMFCKSFGINLDDGDEL